MDPILGMIALFSFPFQMEGWAPCDGRLLPIMQYQALYSLMGTTYGGDGQSTFGIPKMAAPAQGMSYQIALNGVYPQRA
ncbi:Tail Collar domain protein [Leptothrix cholodnii SP-6]|uniref:Tail Collar domain protein n=1 Tax=Leptothrix cholodnii (strain ATCC 51168 / LMG 8142 / SP-6) TaxID=395495 RepID=B1Y7U6_LEPCP|nr:tail fiber protein [Leptothrix cholodnii]ACB32544.1 Tail Collar domain protein [Leptothrix cholodnii SP-6]